MSRTEWAAAPGHHMARTVPGTAARGCFRRIEVRYAERVSARGLLLSLTPAGLLVALLMLPPVACAESIPLSRNWSIRLAGGAVLSSGFMGSLDSEMKSAGWGKTQPPWTDPIFGFTFPGEDYPKKTESGNAKSLQVAHSITSKLAIGAI